MPKKEDLMRGPKLDAKTKKNAPYGGKGEYDLAKEMMKKKAADKKGSYSPKPMSAFAKEKAAMRGAATQAKMKNPAGLKQMNLDKVTKRVGPTKSAFTPAQKAELKKMLSQGGRLDK